MSRFAYTSLLSIILFFAIGLSLHGWTRIWVYMALWTVYLTLVGCGIGFIRMSFFLPAVCCGQTGRRTIALTFDDGPDPAATPALLDLLFRENIHATFFCIGKHVATHPDIVARIHAEGHLLANHTYHHSPFTAFMGGRRLAEEIALAQQAICDAVGVTPIYFRPPVGLTNPHYARVLAGAGLSLIGWDVRSMDTFWTPEHVIARVLRQTRDGSIILLHDGGFPPERVVEITGEIIKGLRDLEYRFERLDRLFSAP